jgi:maleylpyruvate isomerase
VDTAAEVAAAKAAELTARIETATTRLLHTAAGISEEQARQPSLLPGWTRGHVLTHIARNADGLRNLLIWARTGVETPQYASFQARNEEIEAGAGRPATELAADLAASAAAFRAEAAGLTGPDWLAQVRAIRGAAHPAWATLRRRLTEVEIHHVDLAAGYRPADWPAEFSAELLPQVVGDFAEPGCPGAVLSDTVSGRQHRIGPAELPPEITITGPSWELLAWLLGRSDGARLATDPTGPLPPVPAW